MYKTRLRKKLKNKYGLYIEKTVVMKSIGIFFLSLTGGTQQAVRSSTVSRTGCGLVVWEGG